MSGLIKENETLYAEAILQLGVATNVELNDLDFDDSGIGNNPKFATRALQGFVITKTKKYRFIKVNKGLLRRSKTKKNTTSEDSVDNGSKWFNLSKNADVLERGKADLALKLFEIKKCLTDFQLIDRENELDRPGANEREMELKNRNMCMLSLLNRIVSKIPVSVLPLQKRNEIATLINTAFIESSVKHRMTF